MNMYQKLLIDITQNSENMLFSCTHTWDKVIPRQKGAVSVFKEGAVGKHHSSLLPKCTQLIYAAQRAGTKGLQP